MSTRRAGVTNQLRSRASRLLNVARAAPKRRPATLYKTRFHNKKMRPIYKSIRIAYVIPVDGRTLYGRKAHGPKHLLRIAPYQIR
jgi:hypothetical protein